MEVLSGFCPRQEEMENVLPGRTFSISSFEDGTQREPREKTEGPKKVSGAGDRKADQTNTRPGGSFTSRPSAALARRQKDFVVLLF
ncbi:unnamed protein product [Arctogadus glacialis]